MKGWSARSISGRLTALILLISGMALLLAYVSFLIFDYYTLRRSLVESLDTQAAMLATNSESALLFDDRQTAEATLAALRGAPFILTAQIFRADGRAFARYTRQGAPAPEVTQRLPAGQATAYWPSNGTLVLGHAIVSDGSTIGSVYLVAETRNVEQRARQFGFISAGILLVCFAIALLATSSLRGLIIRPLEDLAETARVVSRTKDYTVRAKSPARHDELTFLVESFNEMLDEVAQSRAVLEQKVTERTAELSAANRELEAFAYTVAHDLRGPLQQLSNIAYILQLNESGEQSDEQRQLLQRLVASTSRMSTLIDDLLNLSRAGSAPIEPVAVNLSALARSTAENITQESGRRVELTIAEGCAVSADEGLMGVVLENLLRNAWKYTSRKNPACIEFGCRDENGETVYFVRDNGAGFDAAQGYRLFRPFQRLHSQAEFPGTGVGLATVLRIITRHGGRVWASGAVDQGAEFCFTLPQGKVEEGGSRKTT